LKDYDKGWSYTLFHRYPHLYLPFMVSMIPHTYKEVDSICRIFELYGIGKNARILDFSCGIGRHSIELAKRKFNVVGYDPSAFYIRFANSLSKHQKSRRKHEVEFFCGHPLRISTSFTGHKKFDGAIMMGCLGFHDDEFDKLVLKNIGEVLRAGSILIIELENRDWTIRNFQSYTHNQFDDLEIFEKWEFNSRSSISESVSKFYKKNKVGLRLLLNLRTHIRLYSLHEIVKTLENTGWSYLNSFDNILELTSLRHQSQDMIIVARKNTP